MEDQVDRSTGLGTWVLISGRWYQVQDQVAGVLHVLLDLSLLPTGRRIAKLGLEEVVAGHCQEPGVDLTRLARAGPVHRRLRSAWPWTHGRQASLS
jgi:hypothetical protein